MALEKKPEEFADDVPSWLMTFSDVITLLMTFFILLLTFATSEPDTFERMQVSMFGGGGATGLVGAVEESDMDSLLLRERPRSGRLTVRGSEMPSIQSDPVYSTLASGLAGLEEHEERELSTQHAITIPLSLLVDSQGSVTSVGRQHMKMIAQQLKAQELDVEFFVADKAKLPAATTLAGFLYEHEAILPGRLGVGRESSPMDTSLLKIVLTRPIASWTDGAQAKTR